MLATQELRAFDRRLTAIREVDSEQVLPASERHRYDLSDVGVGGVVSYGKKTYLVESSATYTEVNKHWKEKNNPDVVTEFVLFCLDDGSTRFIEWTRDDELEIDFTDRKINGRELGSRLMYDDGEVVDLSDVDEICEKGWEVFLDGKEYPYDDDRDMLFRSSEGRTHYVSLAEFGDETSGHWLTIESWTSDPHDDSDDNWDHEVWLSHAVRSRDIDIVCLGTKEP